MIILIIISFSLLLLLCVSFIVGACRGCVGGLCCGVGGMGLWYVTCSWGAREDPDGAGPITGKMVRA